MRGYFVGWWIVCCLAACNESTDNALCGEKLVVCARQATCTDSASSTCTCNVGFTGDGLSCVPTTFTKIVAAGGFSCGLASDRGIYCWGSNSFGNLGNSTTVPRSRPTQVGTATDWIDVDARTLAACGIRADHSMWCWGSGANGQLGDGRNMTEYNPTKVISDKPGIGWKALSVGVETTCGIHDDGSLACWGRDRVARADVVVPVAVGTDTDWTDISVGTVLCGLRGKPGRLYCWGESSSGNLGLSNTTIEVTPTQVGTDTWDSINLGYSNACGIRSDNALLCWGNNELTSASLQYGDTPQQIGTATDWQAVSLYTSDIIGLRAGGSAYAWGTNEVGQLGMPPAGDVLQPTPLGGTVTGWSEVSVGSGHSCGIADGQAYCWGAIGDGDLGNGASTTLFIPTRIGGDTWTALAGGAGQCGLRSDGALMCWGGSGFGTGVGLGNTDPVWTPTRVDTNTWSALAASSSSLRPASCAIRDGKPYCWGDNSSGELGLGTISGPQLSPAAVNVPTGSLWTEIAIDDHTCAINADATLWCWGDNTSGELGTGAISAPTTAPSSPLAGAWLHVAVADSMTCGIETDHTLWCWGMDPFPAQTRHLVPTQVGTDTDWAALSMGNTQNSSKVGVTTCAVKTDGTLWCWGMWLGDGSMSSSPTPVQIGTAYNWNTVAVGGEICATKIVGDFLPSYDPAWFELGTLWCWGNGFILGDGKPPTFDLTGRMIATPTPSQIGSDRDWSTVVTSASRNTMSCATKTDGSLWCWGFGAAPIPQLVTAPVPIN